MRNKSELELAHTTQEKRVSIGEKLSNIGIARLIEFDAKGTSFSDIGEALGVKPSAIKKWIDADDDRKLDWEIAQTEKADKRVFDIDTAIKQIDATTEWSLIKRVELLAAQNWKMAKVLAPKKYGDFKESIGSGFSGGITITIGSVEPKKDERIVSEQ